MRPVPPPAVPEWTLPDRLRKARELAGYSQAELATVTGISRQSINSYETGRTTPRKPQLLVWATACHVEYEWLTGGPPGERETEAQLRALADAFSRRTRAASGAA
jgi:transcriptional regulator with XRE-family HTH domain